jgi:hypothetical protein
MWPGNQNWAVTLFCVVFRSESRLEIFILFKSWWLFILVNYWNITLGGRVLLNNGLNRCTFNIFTTKLLIKIGIRCPCHNQWCPLLFANGLRSSRGQLALSQINHLQQSISKQQRLLTLHRGCSLYISFNFLICVLFMNLPLYMNGCLWCLRLYLLYYLCDTIHRLPTHGNPYPRGSVWQIFHYGPLEINISRQFLIRCGNIWFRVG